jgi:hypothetical protein
LCEDGDGTGDARSDDRWRHLPFIQNNVDLRLTPWNGFTSDFEAASSPGACYSPDGKWLFVNIQSPGITFAITGPWGQRHLKSVLGSSFFVLSSVTAGWDSILPAGPTTTEGDPKDQVVAEHDRASRRATS